MTRALRAYTEFCYLVRRSVLMKDDLDAIEEAIKEFHKYRYIFQATGVRKEGGAGFSLPRQHVMVHYRQHIENFGVPNGLCSSITESKHIIAVKKPWRRSSRHNALFQMLQTNQRLEKLAACRVDFEARGMLRSLIDKDSSAPSPDQEDADEFGPADVDSIMNEVKLARTRGMCVYPYIYTFTTFPLQHPVTREHLMPSADASNNTTSWILFDSSYTRNLTLTSRDHHRIFPSTSVPRYGARSLCIILQGPSSVHQVIHQESVECIMR